MPHSQSVPAKLLLLIALLQGLALLLLHKALELEFWPHQSPPWLLAFYSVAAIAPLMLLLGLETGREKPLLRWTAVFALLVFGVGYYTGSQTIPVHSLQQNILPFSFGLTLAVATFKALMYTQHFATGEAFSYSKLFRWSWRNFLTLGLALLFTLSFWALLMLWAALFKAINIDFFHDVFTNKWFLYPALALAHGFGVIIFRQQSQIIDTISRIQQALMKFLLILLVFVSMIFLSALPFSGLQPLWESGGSSLILWMQALMLFFVNAVYQDDPDSRPYPLIVHRFIYLGIACLPIYSAISFYGLSLRIDQYGWTISRAWAVFLWTLLALFSVGYLIGIAKRRDQWLTQLSQVNVRMGLVVMALTLLVNSPLLDFRKLSVHSQIARYESGEIGKDDFDFHYFRHQLGKPGYLALQKMKAELKESDPTIAATIHNLYRGYDEPNKGLTLKEFEDAINVIEGTLPPRLVAAIYTNFSADTHNPLQQFRMHILPVDLNADAQTDYLLIQKFAGFENLTLFYREAEEWKQARVYTANHHSAERPDLLEAFRRGDYKAKKPAWNQLQVGEQLFQVQPLDTELTNGAIARKLLP